MRKALACCCLAASVMTGVLLDYIALKIVRWQMDSKLAMLMFIPIFIIMYWLGTFFEQLMVKDKKLIFKKITAKILRTVYVVSVLAVCAVWIWVVYRYTYFFGDIIANVKEFFS